MLTSKHNRHSIRLKGYDYSSKGTYFITICAQNRQCLFGEIMNGTMKLNNTGDMIEHNWNILEKRFSNIELDEFIIMPNHMHGIINLQNNRGRGLIYQTQNNRHLKGIINYAPTSWRMMDDSQITLGKIIRYFKAKCAKIIHDCGYKYFEWQRNFYEHVIRGDNDLNRIRQYIVDNPKNWDIDKENPKNIRKEDKQCLTNNH